VDWPPSRRVPNDLSIWMWRLLTIFFQKVPTFAKKKIPRNHLYSSRIFGECFFLVTAKKNSPEKKKTLVPMFARLSSSRSGWGSPTCLKVSKTQVPNPGAPHKTRYLPTYLAPTSSLPFVPPKQNPGDGTYGSRCQGLVGFWVRNLDEVPKLSLSLCAAVLGAACTAD